MKVSSDLIGYYMGLEARPWATLKTAQPSKDGLLHPDGNQIAERASSVAGEILLNRMTSVFFGPPQATRRLNQRGRKLLVCCHSCPAV